MRLMLFVIILISLSGTFACADMDKDDVKKLGSEAIEQEDYNRAYELWIEGAKKGDPELQHAIALLISNGYGPVPEKDRDAVTLEWLKKSADQDFPDSINWIADSYKNGWHGLEKNQVKASCWRSRLKEDKENKKMDCDTL